MNPVDSITASAHIAGACALGVAIGIPLVILIVLAIAELSRIRR